MFRIEAMDCAAEESEIRRALKEHMREATVILISHRVTSLMGADEIMVLNQGRVVEGIEGLRGVLRADPLQRAARQLSAEVQRRAMALATILEPLLIVGMGLIVMLIVLAVLMPIIQLNQLVK